MQCDIRLISYLRQCQRATVVVFPDALVLTSPDSFVILVQAQAFISHQAKSPPWEIGSALSALSALNQIAVVEQVPKTARRDLTVMVAETSTIAMTLRHFST